METRRSTCGGQTSGSQIELTLQKEEHVVSDSEAHLENIKVTNHAKSKDADDSQK